MSDIVIEVRDLTKRYGSSTAVIARLLEMKEAANAFWHFASSASTHHFGSSWTILLQKSKVAGPRIFRENMNREATANSYSLNRVTEVACEFNVRR